MYICADMGHSPNLTFLGLMVCLLVSACTKEEFVTDASATLGFSLDTLTFDTVFTARGSATRSFRIYNPHNKFIKINRIWFEEGDNTFFRMNVDGLDGQELTSIDIPPEDSIHAFLEVTVDPDQPLSASPFVINERLLFETNGTQQSVHLEAWGQNAVYLPNRFAGGSQSLYTCQLGEWVWDDDKPYVLFGALIIDSCTLVMPPGTQVYVHGGFGRTADGGPYNDGILYFFNQGKLRVEGSFEEPVVIQGDRLESEFADVAGQWGRIQLGPLTKGHLINHAIIKNAIVGLLVDSLAEVTLRNTQIFNTSGSDLAGYHANITAENCLFHTSGSSCVSFILGGNYHFSYCTLANYGTTTEALRASNFTCLDGTALCTEPIAAKLNMTFRNSIIYGSSRDEIALLDAVGDQDPSFFQYRFENCVVRVDELVDEGNHPAFFDFCDPCLNGDAESALFVDADEWDYHLDSLSIAQEQARPLVTIRRDLEGNDRDPESPDAGCYEYSN